MDEGKVLEAIDDRHKELIQFAQEIVALPSENPPGDESRVAGALRAKMEGHVLGEVVVTGREPHRPNVITTLRGKGGGPTLLLTGHTDVVIVGKDERARWSADPYGGHIIDGALYGRGATDMKGAISAMLYAAIAIKDVGNDLRGNLQLAFTADEEAGGEYGAQYVCQKGLVKADAALLGEPSGIDTSFDYLDTACRGIICFRIAVRGTQMHSSQSDIKNAVNAGVKLAEVLQRMSKELQIRHDPHPLYPQGVTINLGLTLSGGIGYAIVPGYAEFRSDIRTVPGMKREMVHEDIQGFLDKLRAEDPQLDVELLVEPGRLGWIEAEEIPSDHPLVEIALNASERVLGFRPKVGGFTGGTDAEHFRRIAGMPTIPSFGPGLLRYAHGPDERLPVEDLIKAAKIYALTALRYLQ
ncbi:MAG: M20 family metallopeptidase [Dehalococcoidia bacterium]